MAFKTDTFKEEVALGLSVGIVGVGAIFMVLGYPGCESVLHGESLAPMQDTFPAALGAAISTYGFASAKHFVRKIKELARK